MPRHHRVEGLGQEERRAGITRFRGTVQIGAGSRHVATRQEFLRPPDKTGDLVGREFLNRLGAWG